MKLRTKLLLVLVAGTSAFLIMTASIRGMVERRGARVRTTVSVELSCDDAQFEIKRMCDRLVVRLSSWSSTARDRVFRSIPAAERSAEAFWAKVLDDASLDEDETLLILAPSGEVLAANGPHAADPAGLADKLSGRGLIGRGNASGIRAGLIAAGERAEIAAAIDVPPGVSGASELSEQVTGTGWRLALLAPVDLSKTAERVHDSTVGLFELGSDRLPDVVREAATDLWRNGGTGKLVNDDGAWMIRALEDPSGHASFLLVSESRSDFGGWLPPGVRESLIWEALAAFLSIALALRFIDTRVLRPMDRLQGHASRLARTEHGTLAFHSSDTGEFGDLAASLDHMLAKIQADRSEFVRSARIAGMSDVSMGVVHSAGNILNSVNVSTQLLSRELGGIGISDLRTMIKELEDHKEDLGSYVTEDPNGQFLIPFLSAMTEALDDLRTRCLVELESVEHGVAHVIDLIRSQEKYAIGASVLETTSMAEVVDMAVNIATLANERSNEIEIERNYAKIRDVHVDRHKLTSILINIVSNAIEALTMDEVAGERRLELSIYPMTEDRFVVEVTDTGVGIAPENLDVIFNSSFTTKSDAPGQGLHTTANLCKELGIAIGAVSEGNGCGTTIKLRVPYEPPRSEGERALSTDDVDGVGAALPREMSRAATVVALISASALSRPSVQSMDTWWKRAVVKSS